MPIHLSQDKNGYYYAWGNQHKYYFNTPNEEQQAYNKVIKQMKAIYSSGYHEKGGIIIDEELGGRLFPQIRRNFPPYVRNLINEFGEFDIKDITICRNPISSTITKVLDLISLGQIGKQTKKLGYDKLFHLFMLINLANGRVLLLEKNEVINMYVVTKNIDIDSFQKVNLGNKQIKLKDFINNGVKQIGSSIYLYDSVKNNCQHFVKYMLKSNDMLTPELDKYIDQNAKELLSTSPKYVNVIAKLSTNAYAWLNRIVYGKGNLLTSN